MNKTCAISAIAAVIAILVAFGVIYQGEASYTPEKETWYWAPNGTAVNYTNTNASWAIVSDGAANAGYSLYNPNADQGASVGFQINILNSGTRNVNVMYVTNTGFAIITVKVDKTTVGTIDTYAASSTGGNVGTVSFAVTRPGVHFLQLQTLTKNGASGGYQVEIEGVWVT